MRKTTKSTEVRHWRYRDGGGRLCFAGAVVGVFFCSAYGLAAPHPGVSWITGVAWDQNPSTVTNFLRAQGAEVEQLSWRQPGALGAGLLAEPGLLAFLNRFNVAHPLLAGLPDSGPTFVLARGHDPSGVLWRASYAFVDDRLWGLLVSLPVTSSTKDPFLRDRLAPILDTFAALGRACRRFEVATRDGYGNTRDLTGSGCGGEDGQMRAIYRPQAEHSMRVLLFRQETELSGRPPAVRCLCQQTGDELDLPG